MGLDERPGSGGDNKMRYLKYLALLAIFALAAAAPSHAQHVSIGVGIGAPVYYGPAPVCAYGYYGDYPYSCGPYGQYRPEYFRGGVFFGARPGDHDHYGFHGYVYQR